jgi:hypothetical protein
LLEKRIANGEARDNFRCSGITAVHFGYNGMLDRLAEVYLENLRITLMTPSSHSCTRR